MIIASIVGVRSWWFTEIWNEDLALYVSAEPKALIPHDKRTVTALPKKSNLKPAREPVTPVRSSGDSTTRLTQSERTEVLKSQRRHFGSMSYPATRLAAVSANQVARDSV